MKKGTRFKKKEAAPFAPLEEKTWASVTGENRMLSVGLSSFQNNRIGPKFHLRGRRAQQ